MSRRPGNVSAHSSKRGSAKGADPLSTKGLPKSLSQEARIFDISQDAIFLWRQPGGIQFWNKGATELYGYTEKQALGKASYALLKTKFPISRSALEALLQAKASWEGELRQETRDRREIFVSARLRLISAPGDKMLVL